MKTNKIIVGNCVDVMSDFPDECIDLTVTSPPYDNLRTYKGYEFDFEAIANQLFRVTKEGGVVVWVVGDATIDGSETGTSFKQALYFKEVGFRLHDTMIYRKINGAFGSHYVYLQEFEYMFVFLKGRPKAINLIRDRKNIIDSNKTTPIKRSTKNGHQKQKRKPYNQDEYGRRKNIWGYAVGGKQKDGYHPAPFPDKLAQDHIISWSNPGDLVLDPMCGSGTTCKMAKINARDYIGIEISDEYAKIAERRVQVQSMHPLFAE